MKGARVTIDRTKEVFRAIKTLEANEVLIGIPAEKSPRKDDAKIGNAQIGYQNEFGSAALNIPPRPFLIPGVKEAEPECLKRLRAAAIETLTNPKRATRGLDEAGLLAVSKVKAKIKALGNYPSDSPTVRARKAKGFKGTAILRVTGSLLNSITYVIRKRTA